MDFNPYSTEDKQQKTRIIIATVAIAAIVLGIAAWAIIAIVNGRNNTAVDQTAVAVDDNTTVKETEPSAPASEGVTTVTQPTTQTATVTTLPTPTVQQNNVPDTGPEEILPLALVAGMMVTYISSRKFAKR